MRTLFFDCFAGASGNMILGGLVSLGVDRELLLNQLRKLAPTEFTIDFSTVDRSGISAIHADVRFPDEKHHRHLSDIERIIDAAEISATVKERSKAIFRRLAAAESKVHGISVEKVHFHEVGAMDAIVDVVGSCIGFEMLGIERFMCSKIHVGSGFVQMAHGKFPVPPPAVAELLEGIPYYSTEIEGELATPTGVAIISTLCERYTGQPEIVPESTGYGAGTRTYDNFPNAIRLIIGETTAERAGKSETLVLLETNIDDLSPQVLGYTMEKAFDQGALDCWFTPIQMKKNRPAVMLSVLCSRDRQSTLTELLYAETTTLGIRIREVERQCLERELVTVETMFGPIAVKLGRLNGRVVNAMPEYDDVRRAALENGVPFRIVRDTALEELQIEKGRTASTSA